MTTQAQAERTYAGRDCSDAQALRDDLMAVLKKAYEDCGPGTLSSGALRWELCAADYMVLRSGIEDDGRRIYRRGQPLFGIHVEVFFLRGIRGSQLVRTHGNLTTIYPGPNLVMTEVAGNCDM